MSIHQARLRGISFDVTVSRLILPCRLDVNIESESVDEGGSTCERESENESEVESEGRKG